MEETGEPGICTTLLEGHLSISRELVMFLSADRKQEVGSPSKVGGGLVRELVEDWIFPASKMWVLYNQERAQRTLYIPKEKKRERKSGEI